MMQRKATILTSLLIGAILMPACQSSKENPKENSNSTADTTWAILPFNKVDSVNPVLTAGTLEFHCPVLDKSVRWEEKDVFNPAAVVKQGKMEPDKDYEIIGQVNQVCFPEGMVPFRNKWFLYYGTADSKIAVAVAVSEDLL